MSQFVHCYSTYVNHILNNSPSKTAYTFSKTQRFQNQKKEQTTLEPSINANGHEYRSGEYYKQKMGYTDYNQEYHNNSHHLRSHQAIQNIGVKRQVERILRKIETSQKSRSKQKLNSPIRQHRRKDQFSPTQSRNLIYSPTRNNTNRQSPNTVRKRQKRRNQSPNRTYTQQLQEIDHPSKHISVTGYYPTGVELSPTGKYAASTFKNVSGPKFSGSPFKKGATPIKQKDDRLGPGSYDFFSQFGAIGKSR